MTASSRTSSLYFKVKSACIWFISLICLFRKNLGLRERWFLVSSFLKGFSNGTKRILSTIIWSISSLRAILRKLKVRLINIWHSVRKSNYILFQHTLRRAPLISYFLLLVAYDNFLFCTISYDSSLCRIIIFRNWTDFLI